MIQPSDVPRVATAMTDAADILEVLERFPDAVTPEIAEGIQSLSDNVQAVLACELAVLRWAAEDLALDPPRRVTSRQRGSLTLNGGSFVYVAYDQAGVPLYIGCTDTVFGRMAAHESTSPWWAQADRIQWTEWPDRATALAQEADLISLYRPPFNTTGNPDRRSAR